MNYDPINSHNVAVAIRTHKQDIFDLWVKRAQQSIDAATEESRLILVDHLPLFLDQLADMLDPQKTSNDACEHSVCEKHGELRAQEPDYTVSEILKEYKLLRETIFDVLEEDSKARMKNGIRDSLAESFDNAMQLAAEAFTDERSKNLVRDKELAENFLERQENFINSISHDLRNPIGTALMGLELLQEELNGNQGTHETIEIIRRNLERADVILKDLLDVARLKSGHHLVLRPTLCDLNNLIEQSVRDLETQFGKRFQIISKAQVTGQWDEQILRRMIDNLSTNAVKYGAKDKIISIGIESIDQFMHLSVHNEGEAIPESTRKHLFENFSRGDCDEKIGTEGWGIGLAFVKAAAEAHHGHVSVISDREGTTFTLSLPL